MKNEKRFILTDSCIWEKNKQEGKRSAHAIEVVDMETGQVRFIKSGSVIAFLAGEITQTLSQEDYNSMPNDGQNKLPRNKGKRGSRKAIS